MKYPAIIALIIFCCYGVSCKKHNNDTLGLTPVSPIDSTLIPVDTFIGQTRGILYDSYYYDVDTFYNDTVYVISVPADSIKVTCQAQLKNYMISREKCRM